MPRDRRAGTTSRCRALVGDQIVGIECAARFRQLLNFRRERAGRGGRPGTLKCPEREAEDARAERHTPEGAQAMCHVVTSMGNSEGSIKVRHRLRAGPIFGVALKCPKRIPEPSPDVHIRPGNHRTVPGRRGHRSALVADVHLEAKRASGFWPSPRRRSSLRATPRSVRTTSARPSTASPIAWPPTTRTPRASSCSRLCGFSRRRAA